VPDAPTPLRSAWLVGLYAGAITLAIGAGLAAIVAIATGTRNLRWSGERFAAMFAPFVVIVAIAGWAIQRARIKNA
jgi:hypothetical protein